MANKKLSELTAASTLTGSEVVAVVQGAGTVRTTAQAIANLAPSGLTQSQVEEFARDALAAALVAGSNVTITPDDGANTITIAASGGTATGTINPLFKVAHSHSVIVSPGAVGAFDEGMREPGNVLYDPTDTAKPYKLTYTGYPKPYTDTNSTVGWAYSTDGETWTKGGQLISAHKLEDPYVVKVGSTYYLYAEDKTTAPATSIRLYTSSDFVTWVDGGVVLAPSGSGWEGTMVASPVVWHDGKTWHMIYEGINSGTEGYALGYATSTDGTTWARSASNPVATPNSTFWPGVTPTVSWAHWLAPDDLVIVDGVYYLLGHGRLNDATSIRPFFLTSTNLTTWADALGTYLTLEPSANVEYSPGDAKPVDSVMYAGYGRAFFAATDGLRLGSCLTTAERRVFPTHASTGASVLPPVAASFTAAGDAYFPAHEAMTLNVAGKVEAGTGTFTIAKALAAAPTSFSAITTSTTFAAGDVLKVSAASVTGYCAVTIPRTA